MMRTILLTGATDGIGKLTAEKLLKQGHRVLLHGRSVDKLEKVKAELEPLSAGNEIETYVADMANLDDVRAMAKAVMERHSNLDVLINNAGVYKSPDRTTAIGIDLCLVVNTIAPYLLTKLLLPILSSDSRVVNLSSAAQGGSAVEAIADREVIADNFQAYAQSKTGIMMWTNALAAQEGNPLMVSINPGSLLASKMVREGFGVSGKDLNIGADILVDAALSSAFQKANGLYFDNDEGQFSSPHQDALDHDKCNQMLEVLERLVTS